MMLYVTAHRRGVSQYLDCAPLATYTLHFPSSFLWASALLVLVWSFLRPVHALEKSKHVGETEVGCCRYVIIYTDNAKGLIDRCGSQHIQVMILTLKISDYL